MNLFTTIDWFKLVYSPKFSSVRDKILVYLNIDPKRMETEYNYLINEKVKNVEEIEATGQETLAAFSAMYKFILNEEKERWHAIANFQKYKDIMGLKASDYTSDNPGQSIFESLNFSSLTQEAKKDFIFITSQLMLSQDFTFDKYEKDTLSKLFDDLKLDINEIVPYTLFFGQVYPESKFDYQEFTQEERCNCLAIFLYISKIDQRIVTTENTKIAEIAKQLNLDLNTKLKDVLNILNSINDNNLLDLIKEKSTLELTVLFYMSLEVAISDNKFVKAEVAILKQILDLLKQRPCNKVGVYAHLYLTRLIIKYDIKEAYTPLIEKLSKHINTTIPANYNRFKAMINIVSYFSKSIKINEKKAKLLIKTTTYDFDCPEEATTMTEGSSDVVTEFKEVFNLQFNQISFKEEWAKKNNQTVKTLLYVLNNPDSTLKLKSLNEQIENFILAEIYLQVNSLGYKDYTYLNRVIKLSTFEDFPQHLKENFLNLCFILFISSDGISEREITEFENILERSKINFETYKKIKIKLSLAFKEAGKITTAG